MAKRINGFDSIGAAFNQSQTALATLRTLTGADKVGRHDAIVQCVATIAALALAVQPPKGLGNPADHSKVCKVFAEAKMTRYADATVGLSVALKRKGFRSVAAWDDALMEGQALADALLCDLRPKVYTKAELAEREAKAAERKAAKVKEAKEEEAKAKEAAKAAEAKVRAEAFAEGQASAPVITGAMVADLIRAGQFTAEDLATIAEAIAARTAVTA